MGYELGVRIYGLGLELGVMCYWLWIWVISYRLRAREGSYVYVLLNRACAPTKVYLY